MAGATPSFPQVAIGSARFKKGPKQGNSQPISHHAVTVYAQYLALLTTSAIKRQQTRSLPEDPRELHQELSQLFGRVSFINTVQFLWDCGVPVIPLCIRGGFHAAVWRIAGRNAIVLKQQTQHDGRWLVDLLHEVYHTTEEPLSTTFSRVDIEDPISALSIDDNERRATKYALIATLGPNIEDILQECAHAADGSVEKLKSCVPIVAQRHNVHPGVLANAVAYRLAHQSPPVSWWPTATALQESSVDPFTAARALFFENIDQRKLADDDWALLQQALEE